MAADRKKKLVALGEKALADALLKLADRVDVVDDLVERLITTHRKDLCSDQAG